MHDKRIEVTLVNNGRGQEERIKIPVLSILAVSEVWEWVQHKNSDGTLGRKQHLFFGTHIASHMHQGWMVVERAPSVEQLIDQAAKGNKHYLYECQDGCCSRIFLPERGKRKAS